jgi:hypothetical protein
VQNTVSLSTPAVNRLADFWPVLASDNHSYQASLGGVALLHAVLAFSIANGLTRRWSPGGCAVTCTSTSAPRPESDRFPAAARHWWIRAGQRA